MVVRNKVTSEVFLYDHGSTHGTTLNYAPVKAFEFCEVNDGDILRFGESTRMVICHIENEDEEADENETIAGGQEMHPATSALNPVDEGHAERAQARREEAESAK